MGATVDVLWLHDPEKRRDNLREFILQFDAYYVGGGNTKMMLELWSELGIDAVLKEAYDQGKICAGLSAGAICWFEYGSSDTNSFEDPKDTQLLLLEGLGLVAGICSPHHMREPERNLQLPDLLRIQPDKTAYALDDNAAIIVKDGEIRAVRSKQDARVREVKVDGGDVLAAEVTVVELPYGSNHAGK